VGFPGAIFNVVVTSRDQLDLDRLAAGRLATRRG
jgi:hypothetical protein